MRLHPGYAIACWVALALAASMHSSDAYATNALARETNTDFASPERIKSAMSAAFVNYKSLKEGTNSNVVPDLAKVPSELFGIALVTTDGRVYTEGNYKQ